MKNKSLIFTLLFLTGIGLSAQVKWAKNKSGQGFESYFNTTYVNSTTNPIVINHLEEQIPVVPNGPPIPPNHYIVAYDTTGIELWSRELKHKIGLYEAPAIPTSILTKTNDKFWVVVPGTDTLKVGNQWVTSTYNDSIYNTYYFIQMSNTGSVLNYLTHAVKSDIKFTIADVVFDGNGDFVIAGTVQPNLDYPNTWSNRYFTYGTYADTLVPEKFKNFVAKFDQSGNEGNFFQFDCHLPMSWTYKNISNVMEVSVNKTNGNIMFLGMLGDTVAINTNTVINAAPLRQLFLGMIDQNYNYLSSKGETVATSGTFPQSLEYNAINNSFYFTGSWDGLLYYGQQNPLTGSQAQFSNDSYVAKLQPNSINVDVVIPIFPFPNTNATLGLCFDLVVDPGGFVYACGVAEDSLMQIGNTVYHLNNPNWNEFPFVSKLTPGLQIDTSLFASSTGISRFNAVEVGDGSIYLGGSVNGTFATDNVTVASQYQLDALVVRLDPSAAAFSSFALSDGPFCTGSALTTTNSSSDNPTPTYSWSANPSTGVIFNPSATVATPNISFYNSGSYTIICIASNAYGNSASNKTVTVSSCLGMETNLFDNNLFSVNPNPSNGNFEVISSFRNQPVHLIVTNALGLVVLSREILSDTSESFKINLSGYDNGVYFISLESENRKSVKKIVIN